uniref:Uncharacterized protein n=1 Tax=Rhizophora mucronata TaxID=61149 RepID=A0A2P2JPW6_RHIMU
MVNGTKMTRATSCLLHSDIDLHGGKKRAHKSMIEDKPSTTQERTNIICNLAELPFFLLFRVLFPFTHSSQRPFYPQNHHHVCKHIDRNTLSSSIPHNPCVDGIQVATVTCLAFGEGRQFLEIQLDDRISKETRVLVRVTLGHINDVRFQNNGPDPAAQLELMHSRHRTVILHPMLPSNDTKPRDSAVIVEDIEPFGAGGSRQPGDDCDVAGGPHIKREVGSHGAALDEVLVGLGLVEASNYGPDDVVGGVDALGQERGAFPRVDSVGVELGDGGGQLLQLGMSQPGGNRQVVACIGDLSFWVCCH